MHTDPPRHRPINSVTLCKVPRLLGFMVFFVCVAVAQTPAPGITAPPAAPCDDRVKACAEMTDDELLAAASLDAHGVGQTEFGTCYFHTRENCPGCACPFYVKVTWTGGDLGWDDGTGCLQTEEEVIMVLRMLCAEGQCGCPARAVPLSEFCFGPEAWGKDPWTGTCCRYDKRCMVPDGWTIFDTEEECNGVADHDDGDAVDVP